MDSWPASERTGFGPDVPHTLCCVVAVKFRRGCAEQRLAIHASLSRGRRDCQLGRCSHTSARAMGPCRILILWKGRGRRSKPHPKKPENPDGWKIFRYYQSRLRDFIFEPHGNLILHGTDIAGVWYETHFKCPWTDRRVVGMAPRRAGHFISGLSVSLCRLTARLTVHLHVPWDSDSVVQVLSRCA